MEYISIAMHGPIKIELSNWCCRKPNSGRSIYQVSVIPDRQRSITVDRDIDNGQLMSPAPMDRRLASPGEIEIEIQPEQHWPDTWRQLSANEGR